MARNVPLNVELNAEKVRSVLELSEFLVKFAALRENNQQRVIGLLQGMPQEFSEGMTGLVSELFDSFLQAAQNGGTIETIASYQELFQNAYAKDQR